MPYVSDAQRRKFHAMEERGEISHSTVAEYDQASKGKKLPEHVKHMTNETVHKQHAEHMADSDGVRGALEASHAMHHEAADRHRGAHAMAAVNGTEMDSDGDFDGDESFTDEDGD